MSTIETLPIEKLPDLSVTRKAAQWERDFKQPAPVLTSLAGRHWENQATVANLANEARHAEAALEQRAMTDQVAQNYLFKSRELPMKLREHEVKMQEQLMDLRHKEQIQPLEIEAKQAAINAQRRRDMDAIEDARFKARLADDEAEGNRNFRAMIQASGAKRGTPQYAEAVAAAREANPSMNGKYFDDIWATTGSKLDGETAMETFRRIRAEQPDASVSVSKNGVTMHGRPVVDSKGLTSRLTQLERMRQRATDDEQKTYFTQEIEKTKAELGGTSSFADSAISDAPAAAAVDTPDTFKAKFAAAKPGETITFRGKTYRKP